MQVPRALPPRDPAETGLSLEPRIAFLLKALPGTAGGGGSPGQRHWGACCICTPSDSAQSNRGRPDVRSSPATSHRPRVTSVPMSSAHTDPNLGTDCIAKGILSSLAGTKHPCGFFVLAF